HGLRLGLGRQRPPDRCKRRMNSHIVNCLEPQPGSLRKPQPARACLVGLGRSPVMYSEIVWLGAGWTAPTRANANRTTGLPNSYVLTPLADNYTRLPRRCRIRRLQECAKVERPHVGGHQDLPTGGHGDGTAVITESERIPCSQRCWVRADRPNRSG